MEYTDGIQSAGDWNYSLWVSALLSNVSDTLEQVGGGFTGKGLFYKVDKWYHAG